MPAWLDIKYIHFALLLFLTLYVLYRDSRLESRMKDRWLRFDQNLQLAKSWFESSRNASTDAKRTLKEVDQHNTEAASNIVQGTQQVVEKIVIETAAKLVEEIPAKTAEIVKQDVKQSASESGIFKQGNGEVQ